MRSFIAIPAALCLAAVWVLVLPEASALAAPQVSKTSTSLTIPIMLALVALCLVLGVVLRAFSKPSAELSLYQPTE